MKTKNIKLTIAYDGTNFNGWQKTPCLRTIEGELEAALLRLLGTKTVLQAASRTDKQVHAKGQVVNFMLEKELPLHQIERALNAILPKEIRILTAEEKDKTFHPTLDATGKEYHYIICNDSFLLPHRRTYCWHYPYCKLDIKAMQSAAKHFIGKKDFSSFTSKKVKDGCRELSKLEITDEAPFIKIVIVGNKFLYKMVRILAGTLTMIGAHKMKEEALLSLFQKPDRRLAGPTAPAKGLFLMKVFYT
jgi:tRNA pseudouridine38-40 synthase